MAQDWRKLALPPEWREHFRIPPALAAALKRSGARARGLTPQEQEVRAWLVQAKRKLAALRRELRAREEVVHEVEAWLDRSTGRAKIAPAPAEVLSDAERARVEARRLLKDAPADIGIKALANKVKGALAACGIARQPGTIENDIRDIWKAHRGKH
jgi:hypothetical protein